MSYKLTSKDMYVNRIHWEDMGDGDWDDISSSHRDNPILDNLRYPSMFYSFESR